MGKLTGLLNATKKALGMGAEAVEHSVQRPKAPPATAKPDPWGEVEHVRSRQGGPVVDASNMAGLVPKGQEVPLGGRPHVDPATIKAPDLKLQERHEAMGGGKPYPDPKHVQAPNYTLESQPKPSAKSAKDDAWARAKAAVENEHFRTPVQSAGGLSLQPQASAAQLQREAMQRAQAAATSHSQVSMTRLSQAEQDAQRWEAARTSAQGRGPSEREMVNFERVDTSRLGPAVNIDNNGTRTPVPRSPKPGLD